MSGARVLLADGRAVEFDDIERGFAVYPDAVIYGDQDGSAFSGDAEGHPVMDVLDAVEAGLLVGDADLIRAERGIGPVAPAQGEVPPESTQEPDGAPADPTGAVADDTGVAV